MPADTFPGWTENASPNGVQSFSPVLPGTDARQVVYINSSGGIYQDVGALLPNTTYTLTVAAGNQSGYGVGSTGSIKLVNGTTDAGTPLNSTAISTQPINSLADFKTTYTSGAVVSGDLTIVLLKTSGNQMLYDNVRLAAVPEPASLGMLGLGGLGLLARRRRA